MSDVLDIENLRRTYLNKVYDEKTFELNAEQIIDYAIACGELAARYTDVNHADFQAPPTYPTSFQPDQRMPDGFPKVAGLGMDAGKAVAPAAPIRPGVKLTGRTHMHDIYTKTGRSGRMVFFVIRMEVTDSSNTLLASADTSIVIREKPQS